MGKQFLIWFAAALVGGLLLLTVGTYLGLTGPPRDVVGTLAGPSSPQADAAAQQRRRADAPPPARGVTPLRRGDRVPATLTLTGLDGQMHAMSSYRGRRVLLNFWATWCHPCREEMPLLAATQRRHASSGLQVIGVAMDQPAAVRAYLAQTPVNYPIVLGLAAGGDLSVRFNDTRGLLPYSVLIGTDGRIEATHLGKLDASLLERWLSVGAGHARDRRARLPRD